MSHKWNACFVVSLVTVVTGGQFKKLNTLIFNKISVKKRFKKKD